MIAPTALFSVVLLAAVNSVSSEDAYPCQSKTTKNGIICVCDSDYCDKVPALSSLKTSGEYQLYTTSQDSAGFQSILGEFMDSQDKADAEVVVDITVQAANGSILGFGGAFTDTSGFNIMMLPESAQNNLFESYFGDNGIEYTFARVPIGGTDFSLRYYSYDDSEDPTLANFTLQPEDVNYKIPLINKAKELRNGKDFKLLASVWTAPPWMKTNNNWTLVGYLKDEYYQTWADYFLRFFEAYEEQGIGFWGVTNQNEPSSGFFGLTGFPGMAWLPDQINNWIGTNLGPTLRNSKFSDIKIITHDDQRYLLPFLNWFVLSNETTLTYIDGVAVHFYGDNYVSKDWLNYGRSDKKELFILATEGCTGYMYALGLVDAVALGSWSRAEEYLKSIFEDLSEGVAGWIDWNIAVDTEGGPLIIHNNVDAPIIVNASAGEFYKQPSFYALGHFSKFVTPGSVLVKTEVSNSENSNVLALGFLRPDDKVALVIWNKDENNVHISIKNSGMPNSMRTLLTVKAKSINTFLYSAK